MEGGTGKTDLKCLVSRELSPLWRETGFDGGKIFGFIFAFDIWRCCLLLAVGFWFLFPVQEKEFSQTVLIQHLRSRLVWAEMIEKNEKFKGPVFMTDL